MSRLSDLYKAMETLRKEGLSLNDDLERQVSELEEDIIKKEILPVVTETIEPALKQVQRELVLVVDYHPGLPISVSLSRKTNITELIDAKRLDADPEVEHKEFGPRKPREHRLLPKQVYVSVEKTVLFFRNTMLLPPSPLQLLRQVC